MLIISLNLDSDLLLLHNSKVAYWPSRFELGTTFGLFFIFPENLVKNKHFFDADGDKPDNRFLLLDFCSNLLC